jgi:hypothetical protein
MGRTIEGLIEELDLNSVEGLEVEVGGIWFAELRPPESEAIGLAFAVFVLIAVLGSVMAMGATVAAALVTVGVGAASVAAALLSVALFGFGAGIEPLAAGAVPVAVIVLVAGLFGRDRNPLRRKLRPRRERPLRETG